MAFLRASSILFASQLLRFVRSRRALICVAVALLPVALGLFVVHVAEQIDEDPHVVEIGWAMIVQVVVPVLSLILGAAVVSEEIEDRTISYLFTRPFPRAALLWGRWAAALSLLSVLIAGSTIGTLAVFRRIEGAVPDEGVAGPLLGAALLGATVYSALFAALGARFKHPMIIGLAYVFAIEVFLTNLPGKTQTLTIQYYLRSVVHAWGAESWGNLEIFQNSLFESGPEALGTLGVVLVVALLGGSWILSRRQILLPS